MKYVIFFGIIFLASCKAPAPDLVSSKQHAEAFIIEIKNQNWDSAMKYYDSSISKEDRVGKLQQINQAMGDVQEFEFISSEENTDPGQASYILLTYKISRSVINSKEQFKIINDEGNLLVVGHNIENWK